ncbi:MAG: hypothetical protein COA70_03840 [Planctomycetota bacterium]|nr:MAG: hypothetical protein COA70_03840 [Planctomycetota bacterium]
MVREQKSENPTEGGLVQVSSTSGLAVQEIVLRRAEEALVIELDQNGCFPSVAWRAGWRLEMIGHSPLTLGETPTDMELSPFREFRVTGVPEWKSDNLPTVHFRSESLQARRREVLLMGIVDSDWVVAMGDSGSPFGESATLRFPNLRPLALAFPGKGGGYGGVPWSLLVGAEPATLPLDCEIIGLPPTADLSALTWDLAELTPLEELDATYLVAKGSWGVLSFSLASRSPSEIAAGSRARFEGVPLGIEVAVFAGIPNVGFGWTGPRIHEGLPSTLMFHTHPRARVRLLDSGSGHPIPEGTLVRVNWMWGKTKTNILFNPQELKVGADGNLEWALPVDAWSLPIDSPGPYPSKGVQIRVAVPEYEPMQIHMMVNDQGLADFQNLELTSGSWNLVFATPPKVLDDYSYLFFGSALIPAEGGSLESKARMPLPFSKAVPFGGEWSSIWMEGSRVNEELRSVTRGIPSQGGRSHFYRLSSDGAYHRVQVKTPYEIELSEAFLNRFPGWYMDVAYFAPAFSLGTAFGWKQPGPDPSRQQFFGPKDDVFLKVSPPRKVKAAPVFFRVTPGHNSF